jgi:hypothetical protein
VLPDARRFFGKSEIPFYIVAPPLLEQSAGVRLMYQLAHMLNSMGEQAWMVPDGTPPSGLSHSLIFTAPTLTPEVAELHFRAGTIPVVVYSETVHGNPLQAQIVARWILNSPGLLGGPSNFKTSEDAFYFTRRLARAARSDHRLFLPTADTREIDSVASSPWQRRGTSAPVLVYAAKYQQFVGAPRLPRWAQERPVIHIEREGPLRQSRVGLLSLLANAHCLIAYENTAVITEAALLGTPVILSRSEFFPHLLADEELGSAGTAWSTDDDPLGTALSTLPRARDEYDAALAQSAADVDQFRTHMRNRASHEEYLAQTVFRNEPGTRDASWRQRAHYGRRVFRERGISGGVAATLDFAARRFGHRGPL